MTNDLRHLASAAATDAWRGTRLAINQLKRQKPEGLNYPVAVTLKGEPRIAYAKTLLELALKIGVFTKDGAPVHVDGFKLRNAEHWASRGKPAPEEFLELLSTRCAVHCEFCYLRMDPGGSVTQFNVNRQKDMLRDVDFRLSMAKKNARMFSPTFQLEEIIQNPHFKRVASAVRQICDDVFYISTTGSELSPELLDFLVEIRPVELRISLNAVDPAVRARVLGDRRNAISEMMPQICDRRMRFSVSVVMWPSIPWSELEATIRFADKCGPYAIFAILPGFTEKFASDAPLDELEAYWRDVTQRIAALRHSVDSPLILHPRLYEEVALRYPPNLPLVIGVTPGSSAAMAGLRIGDIVVGVDDFHPVLSRRQVSNLLTLKHRQNQPVIKLHVNRGGAMVELLLRAAESYARGYIHAPPYEDQFGVNLISQGIALGDLRELGRLAARHGASRVGLATSSIVLPSLTDMLSTWGPILYGDLDVVPFVPRNDFYGGNICLGELMTAADIRSGIDELLRVRPDVELVIVPSPAFGPGGWWRDLQGVPFTWLKTASPVPVDLLICSPFE